LHDVDGFNVAVQHKGAADAKRSKGMRERQTTANMAKSNVLSTARPKDYPHLLLRSIG
jgi:hypothetical protein